MATKQSQAESQKETTHFGYQTVNSDEKARRVGDVFSSVAERYDVMNDFMSLGIHRLWKRYCIKLAAVKQGDYVLDIAGGTGDLAYQFSKAVGDDGKVFLADINAAMLQQGRDRLIDRGVLSMVDTIQLDAEHLPFKDNTFDVVTIAFGLRNVTDQKNALASMCRVLKPGRQLLVLEFSTPVSPLLAKIYDKYSFNIIPKLGKLITKDEASYQYLVESIRMHPKQDELKAMTLEAGFSHCEYHNLSAGIVALHRAYKD